MQNLHFLCQTLILFAKAVQFCRIRFLTPLRFSRAKRLNLKPPSFQLSACYSKLLGYAALRCARLIKPIHGACFKLVGICSSRLSHLVPLSWIGVKYPTVREQAQSSDTRQIGSVAWYGPECLLARAGLHGPRSSVKTCQAITRCGNDRWCSSVLLPGTSGTSRGTIWQGLAPCAESRPEEADPRTKSGRRGQDRRAYPRFHRFWCGAR